MKKTNGRILAAAVALSLFLTLGAGCGKTESGGDGTAVIDPSAVETEESGKDSGRSKADQQKLEQDIEDGYLILVNKEKENHLAESYKPDDLEHVKYFAADRSEAGRYLRAEASKQFQKMVEDAQEEDIEIVVTTAYRSYSFQSTLFNNYVAQKGEAEANKTSARPGESEHQTGLAADLSTGEINYRNSSDFGDTKAGAWVAENCYKYGFIIRFPDGQEDITGYTYEPWHIRYVGKTAAKEIYDEDITLEEYIEENDLGNSIPKDAKASSGDKDEDEDLSADE